MYHAHQMQVMYYDSEFITFDATSVWTTGSLTAEQKLEKALLAAQALAPKLPSYMAPGAANPVRYQSIQQKKKLMWNRKV